MALLLHLEEAQRDRATLQVKFSFYLFLKETFSLFHVKVFLGYKVQPQKKDVVVAATRREAEGPRYARGSVVLFFVSLETFSLFHVKVFLVYKVQPQKQDGAVVASRGDAEGPGYVEGKVFFFFLPFKLFFF